MQAYAEIFLEEEFSRGCTVLCSVGKCTRDRHGLVAENRDVPSVGSAEIMVMHNPKEGNKYLGISTAGNPSSLTVGVNEKGVISSMAARYCHKMSTQGLHAGVIISRCLQNADSAGEMATQIQALIQKEGKNKSGSAFSCADYRAFYVVEGYKKESEICGPFRDTIFTYGNYAFWSDFYIRNICECFICLIVFTYFKLPYKIEFLDNDSFYSSAF